jgi:hypothetical protein
MRTRRCLGPARRRSNNLLYGTGPARLRHAGRARFVPAGCPGALTVVSVIKSMLKKDRALVELRDLQCTNETIQRSYVVPCSILKSVKNLTISF